MRLYKSGNFGNMYNFWVVNGYIYPGSVVNTNNNISFDTKRRIVIANRYYFGLNKHFRDKLEKLKSNYTNLFCYTLQNLGSYRKPTNRPLEYSREKYARINKFPQGKIIKNAP